MDQISIFNYEAFYLDFLEGNLSEEDTASFLAFLEEHPELKMEDESIVSIAPADFSLSETFKSDLKQISFADTAISHLNINQYLIAQTEGLLSEEKETELNNFVALNPQFGKEQQLYKHTHFTADLSVVYNDKKSLKRAQKIALWPLIAFAAAASVALLIVFWNTNDSGLNQGLKFSEINGIWHYKTPIQTDANQQDLHSDSVVRQENKAIQENFQYSATPITASNHKSKQLINSLKLKILVKVGKAPKELEIIENNLSAIVPFNYKEEVVQDYAMLGFEDMNNPIKPLTSRLAETVKKEIDFRSAKATNKHSGGFYLKLGKLVISRRKF